jgi:hypothetical protein
MTRPSGDTTVEQDPHHPVNAAPAQPRDDEARARWAGLPDTESFREF